MIIQIHYIIALKQKTIQYFLSVSEKAGKDNSGEYVYAKDKNGNELLDKHGHKIKDHDLHNHDGSLDDGIAEAFIEFAKKEKFSFWTY